MKVAIIYFGASSLLEINYLNHKEFIFDYLNNSNIDFDVFYSLSTECIYKDANLSNLITFTKDVNKKINKNTNTNYDNSEALSHKMYGFRYNHLTPTCILNLFKKMFTEDKIKFTEFKDNYNNTKVSNESEVVGDAHNNDCIADTTYYKRLTKIDNFISKKDEYQRDTGDQGNKNYTYYIYIRCDYMFYNSFNLKEHLVPHTITTGSHQGSPGAIRPDFLWISEKKFTEYWTHKSFLETKLITPDDKYNTIGLIDAHLLYKYIKSLGLNIIVNLEGNRIGSWEYHYFLPKFEKKKYFDC